MPESMRYPADLGTDAQPLVARLKYDQRYTKAVQQARRAHVPDHWLCNAACLRSLVTIMT